MNLLESISLGVIILIALALAKSSIEFCFEKGQTISSKAYALLLAGAVLLSIWELLRLMR